MMEKISLESAIRSFLDFSKNEEQSETFALLLEYMQLLFADSEEEILLEDFTAYEADDFLNFFLEDNFPEEYEVIRKKSEKSLKDFFNYLKKKKLISKEEVEEWKEVFG
ncbi:MAG: hypothetical protein SFU98_12535 [Leptospiraceae bacterium]|nr:hypothetical protein [Leptospiraceae bacterium]